MLKHLLLIALGVAAMSVARAGDFVSEEDLLGPEFGTTQSLNDWDDFYRDCRYRDRRECDRRRPPNPYPPYPPPSRGYYTCFAQDTRGQLFRGRDYSRWNAEREALNRCYMNSYYCRIIDCRYR